MLNMKAIIPNRRIILNQGIFPKGMPWNEDNYGPLIVPKKGYVVNLSPNNIEQWKTTIDSEYGKECRGNKG